MFRHLVLGLLRCGEPRHGYALMKEYRARTGQQLSTGNFYRELQRLTRAGLVRSTARSDDEDPRRFPYCITDSGERSFDGWLHTPTHDLVGCCDDELSTRALFLDLTGSEDAARMLATWKEDLWLHGKRLERMREAALAGSRRSGDPGARIHATLLARRLKHLAADLEFLEELRCEVEREASARAEAETRAAAASTPAEERGRAAGSGRSSRRSPAREAQPSATCAEVDEAYPRTRKAGRRRAP